MRFDYAKVPGDMKSASRWVLWKAQKVEGDEERTTKIPINANSGYKAKSNDPETWCSFDKALAKCDYYRCDGLGFMLGNGFFGIDIDHTDKEENKAIADDLVANLQSYSEVSQSGHGVHIICRGVLPPGNRRKKSVEMYDSVRFFALTGNVIGEHNEIFDRTEEVRGMWQKYLTDKAPEAYVFHKEQPAMAIRGTQLSDEDVIKKALESKNASLFNCLYYGQWQGIYPSQSEADMAFCSLLAFWCARDEQQMDRIFRGSGLFREKWDTSRGEKTYGQITLGSAIEKCKEVYTPSEVVKVYDAISGEAKTDKHYSMDDTGNAQRFIDTYGENIRYNFDNKTWLIWDGKTWIADPKEVIKSKADIMLEDMRKEAYEEEDEDLARAMMKNVKHLASSGGKEAMLREAMHIGETGVVNLDMDRPQFLLNCENGIVDLRTGEIKPHDKKLMLSKNTHCVVDMDHDPSLWIKTVDGIFRGSKGLIEFARKAIGYSLTGSTKEQCLFQCYGLGSNGKTLFFNVLHDILGDYALNSQVSSILTRGNNNSGNASPDIARMNGARMISTNEPAEGSRFNEGLVKQLTGGDPITARFLYGKDFDFVPVFKLWIVCNYKIIVRGTDKGIWRRMRLIPFEAVFEGKNDDKDLESKLHNELPSILGWAVKGCLEWQKEGLKMPEEVEKATADYRQEMDIIETYIADELKIEQRGKEKASDVFKSYKRWCQDGNEWCMTQSKFGVEMGKKFKKENIRGYVYYDGFVLKEHDRSYVYEKKGGEHDDD